MEKYLYLKNSTRYFRHWNVKDEDFEREKLIESDFEWEASDGVFFAHFKRIIFAVLLIKLGLFALGNCY